VVIDTSAIVVIALGEPTAPALLGALSQAENRDLSSVSLLEAGIVLRGHMRPPSIEALYRFIEEIDCRFVPFDEAQAQTAIAAYEHFGKGRGHQLNFGDCAVYALAALRGEPVLAVGNDFRAADLSIVQI
jgi:ribonuclease VapC